MGLNIGVQVKKQREEYMSDGSNPKGTSKEIEEELWKRLVQKFPEPNGMSLIVTVMKEVYDFDVSFYHYANTFTAQGYAWNDLYLTLIEYILENFSANYGIDLHVYYSP